MAPTIGRVALDNGFHGSIPGDWVAPPPQNIQVLAVSHHPYENVGIQDLAGIRVNNVCRISGPVNLNLLRRLTVDMHGGAALLLVLLDVIAEL